MKDLKNKANNELEKILYEKKKALRVFLFSIAGGKIRNVKGGRNIRKEIARILTELSSRKAAD